MLLFDEYVQFFESNVALAVSRGIIGNAKRIPVRVNALRDTPFGATMGSEIDSDIPFVIDYYGYLKRSQGQNNLMAGMDPDAKHILVTLVHFSALHIETIHKIAPAMLSSFVDFKNAIIQTRGFKVPATA